MLSHLSIHAVLVSGQGTYNEHPLGEISSRVYVFSYCAGFQLSASLSRVSEVKGRGGKTLLHVALDRAADTCPGVRDLPHHLQPVRQAARIKVSC